MIRVTRLNGTPFVLNAEMIVTLDQAPDTIITLLDGKKFVVREGFEDVIEKVIQYRRLCRMMPND